MQGRQVLQQTFKGNQFTFNAAVLPGVYYLSIVGSNYSKTKKITIIK
ncbi:MAG: T9SS type A sorting domain-containing protein [Bacteroidetes bacterium]|nr:T9SS type A sorting domain-containing protein [Bacteroidota bacterium]